MQPLFILPGKYLFVHKFYDDIVLANQSAHSQHLVKKKEKKRKKESIKKHFKAVEYKIESHLRLDI